MKKGQQKDDSSIDSIHADETTIEGYCQEKDEAEEVFSTECRP